MKSISRSRSLWSAAALSAATLMLLAACGNRPDSGGAPTGGDPTTPVPSATATTPPAAPPVTMAANVADRAKGVTVDTVVSVKATGGTLSKVTLKYSANSGSGKMVKGTVAGSLNKSKTAWVAGDRLEPSATYTLAMSGTNGEALATRTTSTFTTQALTLAQQTFPTLYPLKGSTVGVGMPVVLTFDVPVKNKKAFEKQLKVTAKPVQAGSWHWLSDTQVRYRPKTYWKPGTKVTVAAELNGVNAGNGIYGQNSTSTAFRVGRSMIVKVNLSRDVAKVFKSGKVVRTIYVSGGKPGWQTRSGTKLIMAKEWNKKMTNEMIGAKEDYTLTAAYALRITNSGEFLHSAPWNAGYFGRSNASHGCVGMSNADAGWLISNTLIGDPVVTTGSSRQMEVDNGWGDWNLSWTAVKKGSALS